MKPARHFEDLIVWQLNDAVRAHTLALTQSGRFGCDWKLRSQLEDAAHSACRNISEGFGSDSNREFARYLVISRRSMNEVQDCLRGALLAKYIGLDDLRPIRPLQRRAFKALSGLLSWLERHPDMPKRQRPATPHRDGARPGRRSTMPPQPPRPDNTKQPRTGGREHLRADGAKPPRLDEHKSLLDAAKRRRTNER